MRNSLKWGAMLLITASVAASAQDRTAVRGERFRRAIAERADGNRATAARPDQTIAYGAHPEQVLDFWRAPGVSPAPIILFVHGGGWQRGSKNNATGTWKPGHYTGEGYAFASTNYRLVPNARVEDQAADIASAVKALVDRAKQLGIDRQRIVLMGHSAGAHLVSLVGTDPQYLRAAGLTVADIRGVIALDGAAYDVPRQMHEGPRMMQETYVQAFGTDPVRQRALSPTLQAAAPNVAHFLIPHVQREDGTAQSGGLAKALRKAGTEASLLPVAGKGLSGHAQINRRLGDPAYPPTQQVDDWLNALLKR